MSAFGKFSIIISNDGFDLELLILNILSILLRHVKLFDKSPINDRKGKILINVYFIKITGKEPQILKSNKCGENASNSWQRYWFKEMRTVLISSCTVHLNHYISMIDRSVIMLKFHLLWYWAYTCKYPHETTQLDLHWHSHNYWENIQNASAKIVSSHPF